MIKLKVNRITALIHCPGQDEIHMYLDSPSAHPELDASEPGHYPACTTLKTRKGYAKEWLNQMGVDLDTVKVISMLHGELNDFPEDLLGESHSVRGRHTGNS